MIVRYETRHEHVCEAYDRRVGVDGSKQFFDEAFAKALARIDEQRGEVVHFGHTYSEGMSHWSSVIVYRVPVLELPEAEPLAPGQTLGTHLHRDRPGA